MLVLDIKQKIMVNDVAVVMYYSLRVLDKFFVFLDKMIIKGSWNPATFCSTMLQRMFSV